MEMPAIAENGNSIPFTLRVTSSDDALPIT